ncbi:MAG: LCP family protein [Acidimicrobiia bacterium]|nr:LCP family protein [Acidimicrobiia bacterium]
MPGLGQILVGSVASGGFLLASTIGAGTVAVILARSTDRTQLLEMVTDPDLILMLIGINALLGLIRLVAATDAWRRAGGRAVGLGIGSLALFTLIPHIGLGYVGLETRSTILKVFPSEEVAAVPPTTTTTTTLVVLPLVPAWSLPVEPVVTTTTTTTLPLGTDRFTVLLMGGDAGPGRGGLRTDSMIVASVDTNSGDAALFSLPRNLAGLEFSDGTLFPGLGSGLLNEVYMWGQRNPEGFEGPDPGIAAVKDVAETLLGIPIEHYVLVDMVGFVELVDAMGGVTVTNPKSFPAPLYDSGTGEYEMITFEPGPQHLDGDLALAYSRSRTGSSDYVRMGRQRCVMTALADQASPLNLISRLPVLLNVMERRVKTDIPYNDLPYLINFASKVSSDRTTLVGFDLDYRSGEVTALGLPTPDVPKIQSVVSQVINGNWADGTIGLPPASEVCG